MAHEGGLLKYLALHFLKESQRPPKSWKGHRVTRSRGYLALPSWRARAEAKAALRLKRELWKAMASGLDPAECLAVAEAEVWQAANVRWGLVTVEVSAEGELLGLRPTMGGGVAGPQRPARRTYGELTGSTYAPRPPRAPAPAEWTAYEIDALHAGLTRLACSSRHPIWGTWLPASG